MPEIGDEFPDKATPISEESAPFGTGGSWTRGFSFRWKLLLRFFSLFESDLPIVDGRSLSSSVTWIAGASVPLLLPLGIEGRGGYE